MRKVLLGLAAAAGAMTVAHSASAATELVSSVGVYDWDTVATAFDGGNYVDTGIIFNGDQLVFCVDLQHTINVTSYDPPLVFTLGILDVDGNGNTITRGDSNRIGQLADLGQTIAKSGDADFVLQLEAIQAAIWSIEYKTTAVSGNSIVNDDIAAFLLSVKDNGGGYARALIAHGPGAAGVQNMVLGGVPEPASWALMIGGLGMTGAALRRRRRQVAATA
jgi:hypothetical protein